MRRLLVCAAVIAVIATSGSLDAKTVRCPQKNPLFRINIPDSWTATWDKDGSLTCMPPNRSKDVSVIPSENVNSKDELRAQLSKTARAAAQTQR